VKQVSILNSAFIYSSHMVVADLNIYVVLKSDDISVCPG